MIVENSNASTCLGLCLDPMDVLFFRDGRPFDAASRAYGGLPLPRTLSGALRTAMLASESFDFAKLRDRSQTGSDGGRPTTRELLKDHGAPDWILDARFRGPWLVLAFEEPGDTRCQAPLPLFPVPATLARLDCGKDKPGKWSRSRTRQGTPPGWTDPGLRPLWRSGDREAKHPGGYLTLGGIRRFLEDGEPDDDQWYRDDELFGYDVRTGIGIDAETLTTASGQIYGVRMLALRHDVPIKGRDGLRARVVLYEEMILPESTPARDDLTHRLSRPIPLGGEGRHAALKVVEAVKWPDVAADGDRSLWLLATPGIFGGRDGHRRADRPDAIRTPARLAAASSGSPLAVSGWDIAMNGPRPTRFAVPAGAVYCVEGAFAPAGGSLCSDSELVQEGWGFALRGVWNDG